MKQSREYTQQDLDKAGDTAKTLLKEALSGLTRPGATGERAEVPRLFFPNGVQLIDILVKVQNIVEVHLILSGAPKAGLVETALPELPLAPKM